MPESASLEANFSFMGSAAATLASLERRPSAALPKGAPRGVSQCALSQTDSLVPIGWLQAVPSSHSLRWMCQLRALKRSRFLY